MTQLPWNDVQNSDPEIFKLLNKELFRQRDGIELIASENFASAAVIAAMASAPANKYAEGLPSKRYYGGCEVVDEIESLAIERVCKLFGSEFANVQPHSGAQANAAVFLSLLKPGDRILGLDLSHGGHLTHGSPVNLSGSYYDAQFYHVDEETGLLNYEKIRQQALELKPKLIIAGASAYARTIDFAAFADIAKEAGSYLMVDMAHIAGLVAAGLHPNPVPYADVVTTTTHKTLRGPRGGLILWNNSEFNFNKAVFPGTQGGPLEHVIAAKAVCFQEALQKPFKTYQSQVISNTKALANSLIEQGFKLVSGGSDNHLVLIDLSETEISGKVFEAVLDKCHITVNKNTVPGEKRSPFVTSGIRMGTPAVTTRGFKEAQMQQIASWTKILFKNIEHEETHNKVTQEIIQLCKEFPLYPHWEC